MANTIVLMTALIPTIGHKFLIDYAAALARQSDGICHVILGTLKREPVPGGFRLLAFARQFKNNSFVKLHWLYEDVPQEPREHPDFWNVWKNIVHKYVDVKPDDYFVASELYGLDMANILECKFMPCNRYREVLPVKGTNVRENLLDNFSQIMPEAQFYFRKTVTIFGAESCGKTTMTKALANTLNGYFIPEWAREYLETVGSELTDEKMLAICEGQRALQVSTKDLYNKPFVFQDTDLFSTLYYYKLWKNKPPELLRETAEALKSDMYILMNDKIPFEEDILRYGGTVRESTMQYWEDALKQEKLPYYVVQATNQAEQLEEVKSVLLNFYNDFAKPIQEYKR